MPHVALLVLDNCYLSSLTGLMDLFQVANAHARKQLPQHAEAFTWQFLSMDAATVQVSGGLSIAADPIRTLADIEFDLIYIPGIYYPGQVKFADYLEQHRPLFNWLKLRHQQGALLAANCTGTFLLAETDLLDGKNATTTWWLERQFRKRYPNVALDIRQILTEDARLLCAGAITTHHHLALKMVERFYNQRIAELTAKALLVDFGHHVQQPYQSLISDKEHDDPLVGRAQYLLQEAVNLELTIQDLASQLSVSPRTLIRRFKAVLGIQPSTYQQNLRLEAAKYLLEHTPIPIEEVVLDVGYEDPSSFTRLFQKRVGLTPSQYREKFRGQTRSVLS
ncbi:helix-turn-helix domain-containing protein [Neptuniibacter sp. CAU 1671]|uniref:GlxA family transcriptional regulator n=1 Tax=Neptuniibacter sp. CAU 1671 TaxID=3032593 RepID=UPI0023DAF6C3|nr:helix-turn-helix domain-containing protein [Neptuniibacter sp. CAU 1671]MDF2180555.1 helix-turn-helix domain-containing protein [Neptuniibacter sp. CAU 1671]